MWKIAIFALLLSMSAFAADIFEKEVIKKDNKYFTLDGKPYTGTFISEFLDDIGINYTQISIVKNGLKEGQTFLIGSDGTLYESNYTKNIIQDELMLSNGVKRSKKYYDKAGNLTKIDYYDNNAVFAKTSVVDRQLVSGVCYNGGNEIEMTDKYLADLSNGKFTVAMCIAPVSQEDRIKDAISVTADQFKSDYDRNGYAADQKYGGKNIVITGKIDSIFSLSGAPSIRLSPFVSIRLQK
ncbi:MAG: OB-fold putative lipoprotein, partial [Deferribacteraceae bacterium]|nr:OB-fold putative lipoprotein [Deferribacteraceae bacterium]